MKQEGIRQGWRAWLASNHRGWRILVGSVCVLGLAFFLHFREVRFETLELNATAGRYVVAQVDFEFPDYETTIVLRQQAIQDIGKIYQIDDQQARDVRYLLEDQLIHRKEWRSAAETSTFEEMYKATNALETLLLEVRFTDLRTLRVMQSLPGIDTTYFERLTDAEQPVLSDTFWNRMQGRLEKIPGLHNEAIAYVIHGF